jgi:hypothetical protein
LREAIGDVSAKVSGDAFQAADGDGFGVQTSAATGRLTRPITGSAEYGRENVGLPIQHVSIGISSLRNEPDVFRNIGVGGTSPLAIHYFVEVVRIGGIGRMHFGADLLTSANLKPVELPVIVTMAFELGFF